MNVCIIQYIYFPTHLLSYLPSTNGAFKQTLLNYFQSVSSHLCSGGIWRRVATVNPNAWVWQELELHRASLLFHCIALHCIALYCIALHCASLLLHYCQPYFARSAALPLLASSISVHTCVLYQISRRVAGTKVCNCFSIGESRMHTVRVAV